MLVDAGLLTAEELKKSLGEHKKARLKLGQYLVQRGIVSESQIIDLLSQQLKIEKYHPDVYPIDMGLSGIIPLETAIKCQCVPLRKKARLLTVAMCDPMDIEAMDTVEMLANLEVEPVICTERMLHQLCSTIYGTCSGLEEVCDRADEVEFGAEAEPPAESSVEDLQVSSLQDMADDAPVARVVNSILSQAVREGASDVHVSPEKAGVSVRFRIDGRLHEVPAPPKSMIMPIISRIKILSGMDIAVLRIPQDGRFTIKMDTKEINVRTSTLPTIYGENVVMRLLDMSAGYYNLDRLGMVDQDRDKIEAAISKPYGMILSTGPTGSGKSTSLYAILEKINKPDINIITLEDPVEYRVDKIRQTQLNKKAGMTFASGLRSILRQDPDVIMVGEIRDYDTAEISLRSALTGHLLFTTIHTINAPSIIERLFEMGVPPFLIGSSMLGAMSQRLVRKVCPKCCQGAAAPSEPVVNEFIKNMDPEEGKVVKDLILAPGANYKVEKGCPECRSTGYMGRTGIFELMLMNEEIRKHILDHAPTDVIKRTAIKTGKMRTLLMDGILKARTGTTTLSEIIRVTATMV